MQKKKKKKKSPQAISWWSLIQMQPCLKLSHHNTDSHNFSTAPYKIFSSTSLEQVIFYPTVFVQLNQRKMKRNRGVAQKEAVRDFRYSRHKMNELQESEVNHSERKSPWRLKGGGGAGHQNL